MMQMRAIIGLFFFGLCAPIYAFEPTDTRIDLFTWRLGAPSDITGQTSRQTMFDSGVRDWWNQPWGTRDTISLTDISAASRNEPYSANLNLKQRLLSAPHNTIVDAGVGIKTIGFGRNDKRDGLRLSLGGQIGIGNFVTLYGESAWMPGLIESKGFESLTGLEFESGVVLNPLPYLSIRAAYRRLNLDYTLTGGAGDHLTTEGIVIGTGIHW
jgi:hypothetical protein